MGADYTGSSGADMQLLFWSVLEHGMQLLGRSLNQLGGYFHLHSTIPVGAGMGASAALCVAMSRWFCAQKMVDPSQCNDFAKELEHLFHGKSSGLDVAGVATEVGLYFKEGTSIPLQTKNSSSSFFYLHVNKLELLLIVFTRSKVYGLKILHWRSKLISKWLWLLKKLEML